MIVLLDNTRLYLLYVPFSHMLRTFTLVIGVFLEGPLRSTVWIYIYIRVFACVTFVTPSFAFSAYQRFHVPRWTDNTMVS